MSDATKRRLERAAVILGVVATSWGLIVAAKSAAVATFVTRNEYEIQQQRLENKLDRALDLLCAGRENARQCK